MRKRALLLACTVLVAGQPLVAAMSKSQLLQLTDKGVDTALIVQLVERECVDFEMTADALLELSSRVHKDVLKAAMACKDAADDDGDDEDEAVASAPASGAALKLSQIHVLAVIPATVDGRTDTALTAAILDELRRQRPRYETVDPLELAGDFDDLPDFNAASPMAELLDAARDEGAHALLLVKGSEFRRVEDPGIHLEMKIVEVRQGRVVWSGGGTGLSNLFSWQAAKRYAARNAVSTLP